MKDAMPLEDGVSVPIFRFASTSTK